MLTLRYTGPKPLISQHGITFNKGKEDKYVYLSSAIQILLAIDKDFSKQSHYETHYDKKEKLSDNDILDILRRYEPGLEAHIQEEIEAYEAHINDRIELVKQYPLSEVERKTWINNITLMHPYLIQREVNKLCYIHTLKLIKKLIYQYHIKEININFTLKHWHILTSIAGNLGYGVQRSTPTKINVSANKQGVMTANLLIR